MSEDKKPSIKITVPVSRPKGVGSKAVTIQEGTVSVRIPFKVRFVLALAGAVGKVKLIPGLSQEEIDEGESTIKTLIDYHLKGEFTDIKLTPRNNELKVKAKTLKRDKIDRLFKNIAVEKIIQGLLAEIKPQKEKLHKQPRNLLKTIAKNISNTAEPTLFTIESKPEVLGDIIKEEISKNTAGLALYLIQLYQENNSKPLVIDNLAPLAEQMRCNNHRLKLYLLYLGGFVYPIVDRDEETKQLVLTNEQLFKIEFRYSERVAQKYEIRDGEIQGAERYGTGLLNFIKDEPLDNIKITPSPLFIKAIQGKGLGNILTVSDKFLELVLDLNDTAVKILSYTSSNQPKQKIGEDKLVAHLGLTRKVKVQGKPRVRATILKGFQELKDKGHIKEYSYEDSTGAFTYTYSDMYVKYREGKRSRLPEGS